MITENFKQLCNAIGPNPSLIACSLYEKNQISLCDLINTRCTDSRNVVLGGVDLRAATFLNSIIRELRKGKIEIMSQFIDELIKQQTRAESIGQELQKQYGNIVVASIIIIIINYYQQKKLPAWKKVNQLV